MGNRSRIRVIACGRQIKNLPKNFPTQSHSVPLCFCLIIFFNTVLKISTLIGHAALESARKVGLMCDIPVRTVGGTRSLLLFDLV